MSIPHVNQWFIFGEFISTLPLVLLVKNEILLAQGID